MYDRIWKWIYKEARRVTWQGSYQHIVCRWGQLEEESTTLPTVVYQPGQQFPASGYLEKLLSLINKLLFYFNLGDKQNQKHDESISLYMDHDQEGQEKEEEEIVITKKRKKRRKFPHLFSMGEEEADYSSGVSIMNHGRRHKASLDTEDLPLFSKLSYERKGFDGRGNNSQDQVLQPVPLPTPVLKT